MISDAAGIVGVETHVLRYWEDELELTIPRNEMGHRYYTRENIQEFRRIRELKEKGYQLKAIKGVLHGEAPPRDSGAEAAPAPAQTSAVTQASASTGLTPQPPSSVLSSEERMAQFRELMSDIVGRAISLNNDEISQAISQEIRETVLKEMNYLFREQEESEEERFKKLDAAIRGRIRKKHSFFSKTDKPAKNHKVDNDAVQTT
jgi:DNA-binding transcriptional MerR regulator